MDKHPTVGRFIGAAVLGLCFVAGCPRGPSVWTERQDRLEVNAEGVVRLASVTHNGHQKLTGIADHGDKVVVQAHVRAGGTDSTDAQAALDAVEVRAQRSGDAVKVGWDWKTDPSKNWDASVDFDVTLSAALEADVDTHNGAVTVNGLAASCKLETHNGKVSAETSGPALNATTHNGAIEVTTSAGNVIFECHNGSISARLNAEGEVGGKISTHNGGIVVAFGDNAATALDCSVNNGAVHCDRQLEQGRIKPDKLAGSLKGGKKPLKIETHNGSIKIQ